MGDSINKPKKERRWVRQSLLFIAYQLFKTAIPIFIITTQFDLVAPGQSVSKYTGWGMVAIGLIVIAIFNEIKKTNDIKKDDVGKETLKSFALPTILLLIGGIFFIGSQFVTQVITIMVGSAISIYASIFFEHPYNRMIEENRLIKEERKRKKIEKYL